MNNQLKGKVKSINGESDMKDKLWWVLLGLAAILMLSNARAGEWNEKPVMCEQKEQFESLMVEQGKIILSPIIILLIFNILYEL